MTKKFFTAAVMCGTMLSSLAGTAAFADTVPPVFANPADSATMAAMAAQCDALAVAHDALNGDRWSGDVVAGAVTLVSGPSEVVGSRDIDDSSITGAGVFTPGVTYIQGDPFRIGGSVNLFGDQYATSGSWSDSTYNFTADYDSIYAHAFSCDISQEVYHAAYVIPGHPLQGYYVVEATDQGGEEDSQGSCAAFTANGPAWPHWGQDHAQCDWVETAPETQDENVPESWDAAALVGNEPGVTVNQEQTDTLDAFEDHGGAVQAQGGPFHLGQTVICISPSTTVKKGVPGAWVAKNGYTGDKCTTDWFKAAQWGAGSESSNGTYISVPNYSF
jgi:hypothetical protein